MFLGVSARLRGVDMTDEQRTRLAARIRAERMRQYASKSAAYRQAGLNAATWDRLEQGERVREDRLIAALKLLRSEEHTSELQSRGHLVCRLLLEKEKNQ